MNNNDTITLPIEQNTVIPKGYKKTAIGVIPVDWDVKRLGDLCFSKGDYGINAAAVDFKDDLPAYIRITDIDDDGYFSSSKKCSVDDINSSSFYLNKNDIVFVRTGATTGKAYLYNINDGKLVFAGFLIRFKTDISKVNDYFLWSYTQSKPYWDWVKTVCTRSGQPGINSTEYASIQLPIPPLHEQQKIAEILSTWDEAITNCKTTINTLKSRNKGLAQQLLTGKKRLSGFSERWTNTHLGKIATRITTKNEELNDTVVTISAQRGFVLQEDFFNKRVASNTLSGYYLLKKGQFAYNKSYSNGYPMGAFKRLKDFEKAVVTTLYICFELKQNICPDYMVYFFENGLMINNLMKVAKEGGRAHGLLNIGLDDFLNLELKMPPFNEQTAISQVLETANQELKSYEEKLKALQLQKKGLMQQLLTGKLRVNVN